MLGGLRRSVLSIRQVRSISTTKKLASKKNKEFFFFLLGSIYDFHFPTLFFLLNEYTFALLTINLLIDEFFDAFENSNFLQIHYFHSLNWDKITKNNKTIKTKDDKSLSKALEGPKEKMNLFTAINNALDIALASDPKACIFGEDVGFGKSSYIK